MRFRSSPWLTRIHFSCNLLSLLVVIVLVQMVCVQGDICDLDPCHNVNHVCKPLSESDYECVCKPGCRGNDCADCVAPVGELPGFIPIIAISHFFWNRSTASVIGWRRSVSIWPLLLSICWKRLGLTLTTLCHSDNQAYLSGALRKHLFHYPTIIRKVNPEHIHWKSVFHRIIADRASVVRVWEVSCLIVVMLKARLYSTI